VVCKGQMALDCLETEMHACQRDVLENEFMVNGHHGW
jgi:hypothetical protein